LSEGSLFGTRMQRFIVLFDENLRHFSEDSVDKIECSWTGIYASWSKLLSGNAHYHKYMRADQNYFLAKRTTIFS